MANVVEVVVADINLGIMSRCLKEVDLDSVLSKKGPFTIFAPTDMAFAKLQPGLMESWQKAANKEKFLTVINHHIVEEKISFKDFKDKQKLATANGRELIVEIIKGRVFINGATIQRRDSIGSNGVVHCLDRVIEMNN